MKVMKLTSAAIAVLVGIGTSVAMAVDCASGECKVAVKSDASCPVKAGSCATDQCPAGMKADGKCCAAKVNIAVVNTEGLATLLDSKVPLKLFDARSGKYDDGQRIPGAQQLSPDADEAVIAKAIPEKTDLIVTYCAGVKCPASKALADRLKKLGYSHVIEYPLGIAGWLEAGKAVEKK